MRMRMMEGGGQALARRSLSALTSSSRCLLASSVICVHAACIESAVRYYRGTSPSSSASSSFSFICLRNLRHLNHVFRGGGDAWNRLKV